MIPFMIDSLTPCLKNVLTGDIVETEVVRVKRKSFLSKFNERTGGMLIGASSRRKRRFMRLS